MYRRQSRTERPGRARLELTKSQRKLEEAELVPHDPPSAGPYEAYGARQAVTATWSTEFPTNRRRADGINIMRERSGVRGPARSGTNEVDAFKLFITDEMIAEIAEKNMT